MISVPGLWLAVAESHWGSRHWVLGDTVLGHLSVALHSPRGRDPGSSQSREEAVPRGSPGAPEGSRAPQAGRWCPGIRGTLGTSRVLHIYGECHSCCLSKGSGHRNELGTRSSCEAPEASGFRNLSPTLMNPSPRQEWAAGPRRGRLRIRITWGAF